MDNFVIIIAIGVTVILIFIFPLMTTADQANNMAQLTAEAAVTDFVDETRKKGEITQNDIDKLVETLGSTGNTYEYDIIITVMDDNYRKKAIQSQTSKIGENQSYDIHKSNILEVIEKNGKYKLNEGYFVYASAWNTNLTLFEQLQNSFYFISGKKSSAISTSHGGMVTAPGK